MGKNRDLRRAQAHCAAQAPPAAVTHIAFMSPAWKVRFWHDVRTGDNVWVLPADAVVRDATAQEQLFLNDVENNDVENKGASDDWVPRLYGIMEGKYWCSEKLGRVQRASPY